MQCQLASRANEPRLYTRDVSLNANLWSARNESSVNETRLFCANGIRSASHELFRVIRSR